MELCHWLFLGCSGYAKAILFLHLSEFVCFCPFDSRAYCNHPNRVWVISQRKHYIILPSWKGFGRRAVTSVVENRCLRGQLLALFFNTASFCPGWKLKGDLDSCLQSVNGTEWSWHLTCAVCLQVTQVWVTSPHTVCEIQMGCPIPEHSVTWISTGLFSLYEFLSPLNNGHDSLLLCLSNQ